MQAVNASGDVYLSHTRLNGDFPPVRDRKHPNRREPRRDGVGETEGEGDKLRR